MTKYNYYKNIICKLDLDIPAIEKNNFFKNYKLDLFALDLDYFTKNEREALVISDALYRDISNINRSIVFREIKLNQNKWVYKLSMPTYHADENCQNLKTEFNNVRIPRSLDLVRVEEYREFFMSNKAFYGYKAGLVEPTAFARKLKEKFGLTESHEELVTNHILPEIRENSGVEHVSSSLEQAIDEINELIDIFKNFVKEEQVSALCARRSWLITKADSGLSKDEYDVMMKIYEQKRRICARILHFIFNILRNKGLIFRKNYWKCLDFRLVRIAVNISFRSRCRRKGYGYSSHPLPYCLRHCRC